MTVVRLKGLNRKRVRLAGGRVVTYVYAWKGGPRIEGEPGSAAFMAAYNAAVVERRATGRQDTLAALVRAYKSKPEFQGLADSTRAEWARWLDRIVAHPIGDLSLRLLADRRVRADLMDWRDEYADRPRAADYGVQVLSRVLSFAVGRGMLGVNLAAGIPQLYESDRADQIWTAGEIARFVRAAASDEVGYAVQLACLTGLRLGDLARLQWSHVGEVAIILSTGKSRGRRNAVIPILAETRALLAEIRERQFLRLGELRANARRKRRPEPPEPLTVLSNSHGRPWTTAGLGHMIVDAKARATPPIAKHLHDARGTFGTRLRRVPLAASEIADILGWTEDRVERLLATYVDQEGIVMDIAERIRKSESRE